MNISPQDLYAIVETYAGFGDHRTASPVDRVTTDWFADHLAQVGGTVEKQPFSFDGFEYDMALTVDRASIDALPLFYRYTGICDTKRVSIARLVLDHEDGAPDPIPGLCRQAVADGRDALVLATGGDTDGLVAINRAPEVVGDIPVILVAGRDFERLQRGTPHLTYSARLSRKTAHNVIARLGDPDTANRIVLTTPLSGWFGCAGERGTGIAVLLGLVETLRKTHAFTVIGASGHELMYLGGEHAAAAHPMRPDLVLHLGSCIGTADGHLDAVLHAPADPLDDVRAALAPLTVRLTVPDNPKNPQSWIGESRCWAGKTVHMLSIAGASRDFHTPEDTPERATSPDQLARALTCIRQAFRTLC